MRAALGLCLLLALAGPAWGQCASELALTGARCFFPIQFEQGPPFSSCGTGLVDDTLSAAFERFDITDYWIYIDETISDSPSATFPTWAQQVPGARFILGETHGNEEGFVPALWLTTAAREAAYQNYLGWIDAVDMEKIVQNGHPAIFIFDTAIEKYFGREMDQDALLVLLYCYSDALKMTWLHRLGSGSKGRSFLGYGAETQNTQCYNLRKIITGFGCLRFPSNSGNLDEVHDDTWFMAAYGNFQNRMSCRESCWDWAAKFVDVGAGNGHYYWSALNESAASRYVLRGYVSISGFDRPDTITIVSGMGTNGYGRVRSYAYPVGRQYVFGDIVEIDAQGVLTPSRIFDWSADSDRWATRLAQPDLSLDPLDPEPASAVLWEVVGDETRPVDTRWQVDGDRIVPTDGVFKEQPDNPPLENCGDVVIYGRSSTDISRVKTQVTQYRRPDDYDYLRTRCFIGSSNPVDARNALLATLAGNQAWNDWCEDHNCGQYFPQNPGPKVIIVGDNETTGVLSMTYADDAVQTCLTTCRTYQDIVDVFGGDHKPDAGLSVVAGSTSVDIGRWCEYADDYNQRRFVDPQRRARIFLDDSVAGQANLALRDRHEQLAAQLTNAGSPATLYRESAFQTYAQRAAAGVAALDTGAEDLWITGYETAAYWWTDFLNTNNCLQPTRQQRLFVHAPSCQTVANWYPEGYDRTLAETLAGNDPTKTCLAGSVGQLNADWDPRHLYFEEVWANTLLTAPAGSDYALLLRSAIRTTQLQFPRYGRGIVLLGAHLITPERATSGTLEPETMPDGTRIWAAPSPNGTRIHFWLARSTDVQVKVFDVASRLVSTLQDDHLGPGEHVVTWFQRDLNERPVATGIYFVQLVAADGASKSVKVLVCR